MLTLITLIFVCLVFGFIGYIFLDELRNDKSRRETDLKHVDIFSRLYELREKFKSLGK
jgi:uncharacterized membrane-anchored protein